MNLPPHAQAVLKVPSPIEEGDLGANPDVTAFAQSAFGLSGPDFAAAADQALAAPVAFEIVPALRAPRAWRYLEIACDGVLAGSAVCIPDIRTLEIPESIPPNAASQTLVGAWLKNEYLVADGGISPQKAVVSFRPGTAASDFAYRLLTQWVEACPSVESCRALPTWVSKSGIRIDSGARILGAKAPVSRFQDLFIETVSEVKSKWRYLSIYRIFEHGYISVVFSELESTFFETPKESVNIAGEALDSELKQFVALMHSSALEPHFERFHDEFETIRMSGNRFATALERSIRMCGQIKLVSGKSEKGVLICYKIRCAIVHAGLLSPIFDAHPDGAACLDALLPGIEAAVLQFLGISAD